MFGKGYFSKYIAILGFIVCATELSTNPFIGFLATVGTIFFWISLDI